MQQKSSCACQCFRVEWKENLCTAKEAERMRKMRERILEERWQIQQAELSFSCKQVELAPLPGEIAEGSFGIFCEEGMYAEGFVRAADERISCSTPWFSGSEETVFFKFDASGMQENEVREGFFQIISDCGEYRLPYRIVIREQVLMSSMGEVRNLFHFTNLARASWKEAVNLFYQPEFVRIFDGEGEAMRNLYRGFAAESGNEYNVEQFLVAVRKKQPIAYSCAQSEIRINDPKGRVREEIVISRNGWGAVGLVVRTEGDFLSVEKKYLTEDSFLGNQCRVPVYIDEAALRAGRNFGRVEFSWPGGCIRVEVTVERQNLKTKARELKRREVKQCSLQMVRLYEQLRTKKLSTSQWQKEAAECVERMLKFADKDPAPRLFKAHLLITENKLEEAEWILEHAEPLLDEAEPVVLCYYLYLNTLYEHKESYVLAVERKMKELLAKEPGEWRIAWLLLFLSKELNRSASRKWMFLEECFALGCVSPVLYLEALQLFNANPALLPRIEGYVLRILHYGARKKMLSKDLIGQILYMAGKEKYYNAHLYEILKQCYEQKPDTDTLQAICALLIKGGKTGTEYYSWYLKGVQKNLRITRLYEHYMMSLDLKKEEEIPRMVLMYFAYQSDLDYEYAACIYAYVEKNCREDTDLYAAYRPQIERFVLTQLQRGRISRHLAYLYERFIQGPMLTKENGAALAALLPKAEVEQKGDKGSLIAVHARLKGEERCSFSRQTASVELYSDADILFIQEDGGNRCLADEQVKVTRLFANEELRGRIAPFAQDCVGYCLLCVDGDGVHINEENAAEYQTLTAYPMLEEAFRQKVCIGLLKFYFEKDDGSKLDELLEQVTPDQIADTDRAECARLLILRGFYEKGYEWLAGTDIKKQDARVLMRLGSRLLEEGNHTDEKRMTILCAEAAISGKYDARILKQLVDSYEGTVREMEVIYQEAEGFELETFPMCERLIGQMLFTGADVSERMDLLRQYVREGGSNKVICAFLHRCACRYIMKDEPIHLYMIQLIGQMMRQRETVSAMCEIAYLEYYSRNKDARSTESDRYLAMIGEKMYKLGRLLPVLKEYVDILPQAAYLEDKSFVILRGQRAEAAWIHYRLVREGDAGESYASMPMRHIYGGIFTADFLLFTGETLQYFITWGPSEGEIVESGFLKAAVGQSENMSRYAMLGAVTAKQLEKKDGSSAQQLREYLRTEFYVSALFKAL